jgi:hypothetical protein
MMNEFDYEEEARADDLSAEGDDREEVRDCHCYKCGALLNSEGICPACNQEEEDAWGSDDDESYLDDYDDSMDGDFDSGMRDAGYGTDEDYNFFGEGDW